MKDERQLGELPEFALEMCATRRGNCRRVVAILHAFSTTFARISIAFYQQEDTRPTINLRLKYLIFFINL